jgi:S-DNA-T family DNA segregation ATPase FtsK/SpoIIIE
MEECSINKISKEFKIGFNRAQKIVELLSEMGVVSDNLGSKARTVLVNIDQLDDLLG